MFLVTLTLSIARSKVINIGQVQQAYLFNLLIFSFYHNLSSLVTPSRKQPIQICIWTLNFSSHRLTQLIVLQQDSLDSSADRSKVLTFAPPLPIAGQIDWHAAHTNAQRYRLCTGVKQISGDYRVLRRGGSPLDFHVNSWLLIGLVHLFGLAWVCMLFACEIPRSISFNRFHNSNASFLMSQGILNLARVPILSASISQCCLASRLNETIDFAFYSIN